MTAGWLDCGIHHWSRSSCARWRAPPLSGGRASAPACMLRIGGEAAHCTYMVDALHANTKTAARKSCRHTRARTNTHTDTQTSRERRRRRDGRKLGRNEHEGVGSRQPRVRARGRACAGVRCFRSPGHESRDDAVAPVSRSSSSIYGGRCAGAGLGARPGPLLQGRPAALSRMSWRERKAMVPPGGMFRAASID